MIEFRLLGSVDLKVPEGTVRSVLAQPKRVALLAYLAVARPNGFHRRDKLLGLFWAERDQEHGRGALRKALYLLRQSLGEEVIVSRGDEEIGLAEGAVWCDTAAFEAALDAGEPEQALELYRGHLLDGFYIAEAPEFERWVDGERERLCDRASEAAWALADEAEAAGNGVEAAKWARKAVSFSPSNEAALRRLLELLDRLGDRTGAIKEYEAFARRSQEEYETEPSPETQAVIAAIREREVATAGSEAERPVESPAGIGPAATPEPVPATVPTEPHTEPRPVSLLRVLGTYALVSLAVLVVVQILTLRLGLPDWFFPSAVVVLLVCLPIIVATGLVQGATISARPAGEAPERPSTAARRWLTWRNAVGLTVFAFALLGLAVTGYMAMRVLGVGPWGTLIAKGVLQESDVIVLADFANRTGDSALALTVTDVFRWKLEESRLVRVADRGYLAQVLREQMGRDPDGPLMYEVAREAAIRKGVKAVIAGSIGRLGASYVLTARIVAAETGRELYSHQETAEDQDAIMLAIPRLSARLLERIGGSLKTVRGGRGMSSFAWTSSLEAARLFTEAVRGLTRGENEKAVDRASQAIEIDSLMASAYGTRANALVLLGTNRAQMIADFTRAYELRHRGPPRFRYFIEAYYHTFVTGDREKQLEAYSRVLELGPEWSPAAPCPCPGELVATVNNLGWHYYTRGDHARAEEMFRRRLAMDSARGSWTTVPWINFTRVLFDQGRIDEAEEAFRRWQARMPDNTRILRHQADFASAQGDFEAAAVYLRDWRDRQPENRLRQARFNRFMARLPQVQGKLAEAEDYLRRAMAMYEEDDHGDEYLESGIELASLRVWFLGDTVGALETVAAALEQQPLDSIEPVERPYAELAGFYAFAGTSEQARRLLAAWKAAITPEFRWMTEIGRHTALGAVALAEGRAEDALAEYRLAQEAGACPKCALPWLAQAYEIAGEPDSAMAIYERYVTTPWFHRVLSGGSLASPAAGLDPYWLPVIYERLGDLYEQRGDTAKAILYYGKLVDLWKDADPELQPRVEAARRAMEALSPDT